MFGRYVMDVVELFWMFYLICSGSCILGEVFGELFVEKFIFFGRWYVVVGNDFCVVFG